MPVTPMPAANGDDGRPYTYRGPPPPHTYPRDQPSRDSGTAAIAAAALRALPRSATTRPAPEAGHLSPAPAREWPGKFSQLLGTTGACGASAPRPPRSSRSSWCSSWRRPVATPPQPTAADPPRRRRVPRRTTSAAPRPRSPPAPRPLPRMSTTTALPGLLLIRRRRQRAHEQARHDRHAYRIRAARRFCHTAQLHRGVGPGIPGHLRRVRLHGIGHSGRLRESDPQARRRPSRPSQTPTPPKLSTTGRPPTGTACKTTHIKFEYQGASTRGRPRRARDDRRHPDADAQSHDVRRPAGQQCERNMAVRANVIVDVRACSPTVGSSGLSIATAIADKIK